MSPEAIRAGISRIRGEDDGTQRTASGDGSRASRAPAADAPAADALGPRFGPQIEVFAALDSTMDVLAAAARAGAPAGSVVVADFQRAGRGRLKRAWLAPPGSALMLSMLFRPDPARLPPERTHELGMAVGLAAHDLLRGRLPAARDVRLKWPNDLLVDGRKIAGLLAEASWNSAEEGGGAEGRVIVGLGLNVRQRGADLPEGATSLAEALEMAARDSNAGEAESASQKALVASAVADRLDRSRLAAELLVGVERWVARLQAGASLVPVWSERLDTLGRRVVARRGEEQLVGVAEGVDADGALRIRLDDGRVERLHAGDVTLAPA